MKEAHEIRKAISDIFENRDTTCIPKVEIDTPFMTIVKVAILHSISLVEINNIIALGCIDMDINRGIVGLTLLITIRKS